MTTTEVQDVIDAEIATLTRVVDAPTGPLGYGRDLSCVTDLIELPNGELAEVDPHSTRAIGEAIARRYITERGSILDDPDQGLNLRGRLNRGATRAELLELGSLARAEALKDDRVLDAQIQLTLEDDYRTITIAGRFSPADPELDDFELVAAITDTTLSVETRSV